MNLRWRPAIFLENFFEHFKDIFKHFHIFTKTLYLETPFFLGGLHSRVTVVDVMLLYLKLVTMFGYSSEKIYYYCYYYFFFYYLSQTNEQNIHISRTATNI